MTNVFSQFSFNQVRLIRLMPLKQAMGTGNDKGEWERGMIKGMGTGTGNEKKKLKRAGVITTNQNV